MPWRNATRTADIIIEGEGGHWALLKIRDGINKSRRQMATMKVNETNKRSKTMCMIYTVHTHVHLMESSIVLVYGHKVPLEEVNVIN